MDAYPEHRKNRLIIRNSHLAWGLLVVFCLVTGSLSVLVPPMFMMGLAAVLVSVVVVFKYPYIGLLIYLATFLIRPAELYPALEPLRVERMIGILVLLATLIKHKRQYGRLFFPNDLGTRMLLLFWGLLCVSWVISYDRADTVATIESLFKLIVFYIIVIYEVNSRKRFDVFMGVFLLLIAFIAFLAFRDYYGGGAIYRMGITRAVGRTSAGGDANTLAGTLATTVPLVIMYFRAHKHLIIRLGCLGVLGLLLLMIVNTGSRTGLLTLLAGIAVLVWFSRYRLVTAIVALLLLCASWFVIPDQYRQRYMTMVDDDRDLDEVSSGRVAIWENGLRMFFGRPLYGVGGGAFRTANGSGDFGPPIDMQPHSIYIQIFATYGIIGALVWFTFLGHLIWQLLHARAPAPDDDDETIDETSKLGTWYDLMRQAMFCTVVGLMVAGVFSHSLYRYTWYLMAAMAAALTAIYTNEAEKLETKDNAEPVAAAVGE